MNLDLAYPFEFLPEVAEIEGEIAKRNIGKALAKLRELRDELERQQNEFEAWCDEKALEEENRKRLDYGYLPF